LRLSLFNCRYRDGCGGGVRGCRRLLNLGRCKSKRVVNRLLLRRHNNLFLIFPACGVRHVLANDKQERGYK
jgi:hypothetical protein